MEFKMSHEVETMAWTSEKPWHGLGFEVSNDLTPEEMMVASKTNWTVSKAPMYAALPGGDVLLPEKTLYRDSDMSILDIVGDDWLPVQNAEAFDFFNEFVKAGDMTMETAGSLKKGKTVFALAKVNKSFTLFGGDKVESYLLFTNPHQYGKSIDVRFCGVRVVCNNTLTMALNSKVNNVFKQSHRVKWDTDTVKATLGVADKRLQSYEELASFLGSKEYTDETVKAYFDEVFPSASTLKEGSEKKSSRNAQQAFLALTHQPGVEFAPNSWWQAINAVTFVTDHLMGRSNENRLDNAWYGPVKDKKILAFTKAKEYADAA
jgi:phage/plasmid-like protein (TIGR03299 family)